LFGEKLQNRTGADNQDRYHGDPKGFLSKLAARGFKPVVINDPGV